MRDGQLPPRLIQVALSVVDLRDTERWLREGFGFVPAGGSRRMMRGLLASRIQGLPRVASTCWWLGDRNDWFQIEMFQFERPIARLMPHDARGMRHRLHPHRVLGSRLRRHPGPPRAHRVAATQ